MALLCLEKTSQPDFASSVSQADFLKAIGEPTTLCDTDRAAYLYECLGPVAVEVLEDWLGLTVFSADYTFHWSGLCGRWIVLPRGPVTSIMSVEYRDENDQWLTVDPAIYTVECGKLRQATGACWPISCVNEYRATYTAGYANWAALPKRLQYVIAALVRHWDVNPDSFLEGACKAVPMTMTTLVHQLKERRSSGSQVQCTRRYEIANYVST